MENLSLNFIVFLLFAFFSYRQSLQKLAILHINVKNSKFMLLFPLVLSLVLFATPAHAEDVQLFRELIQKGSEIFIGLRDIVYVVAGFGIIGVAISGFFGNLNWKWLSALIVGLMVIALTTEILRFVADDASFSIEANAQSLK